jgi:hypothetical protein
MTNVRNQAELAAAKDANYLLLTGYNPGKYAYSACVKAVFYDSCSGKLYPPENATVIVFYHKTDLCIEFGKILDLSISHSRVRDIIGYAKNVSIRGGDLFASIDSPNICIYHCRILYLHLVVAEDVLMEKCEFDSQITIAPKFLTLRHMTADNITLKGKCAVTYIDVNSAGKKIEFKLIA